MFRMSSKSIIISVVLVLAVIMNLNGQESTRLLTGKVSYITAQNIYVKFPGTENIHKGDTVFIQFGTNLIPIFLVESLSSVSCVGKPLVKTEIKLDDDVFVRVKVKKADMVVKTEEPVELPIAPGAVRDTAVTVAKVAEVKRKQDIQGSVSVSSYSNLSNTTADNSQRMRYTFSARANNIVDSRFSAESYVVFSHRLNYWSEVQQNLFNALKIYSLSVKYDLSDKTSISAGRKINNNLSNIGAVDGIQAETRMGQFTMGAVAGSRPNDADYNINFKLLEYGAFAAHNVLTKNGRIQTSFAFFEQRNSGFTDRRFAYFQHDNALLKNLFLFTSCELDLYKVVEGIAKNQPTLTSLYLSLRYKPFKQLSLFASYDARKNVIYYETYKSYTDRLLEEATRQGLQLKVNYRPGNKVSMGVNAGYRFRDKDINPNENLNGYLTINQVPWIKATATITANLLKTNYLNGQIYEIRLSRDIIPGKMYTDLSYRFVDYNFLNSSTNLIQNIAQLNLSWQFKHKMSLSIDYELTFENVSNYHRVYLSFNKRF